MSDPFAQYAGFSVSSGDGDHREEELIIDTGPPPVSFPSPLLLCSSFLVRPPVTKPLKLTGGSTCYCFCLSPAFCSSCTRANVSLWCAWFQNTEKRRLIFDSMAKIIGKNFQMHERGESGSKGTYIFTFGAGFHGQLGRRFVRGLFLQWSSFIFPFLIAIFFPKAIASTPTSQCV